MVRHPATMDGAQVERDLLNVEANLSEEFAALGQELLRASCEDLSDRIRLLDNDLKVDCNWKFERVWR